MRRLVVYSFLGAVMLAILGLADFWPLPGPPGELVNVDGRNVEREIQDDHEAISALAPDRPLVLVGHSFAGLLIRAMKAKPAGRVAGMVYVDPATTALWRRGIEGGEMGN
jgi:pimeloyl-ACP methyl ester carboxylesterase